MNKQINTSKSEKTNTKLGEVLEQIHDHRTAAATLPRLSFCENSPKYIARRY